jgi:hypothetical protein
VRPDDVLALLALPAGALRARLEAAEPLL